MHCGGLRGADSADLYAPNVGRLAVRRTVHGGSVSLAAYLVHGAAHLAAGAGAKALCGMAVLFNLYGAVYMLGA